MQGDPGGQQVAGPDGAVAFGGLAEDRQGIGSAESRCAGGDLVEVDRVGPGVPDPVDDVGVGQEVACVALRGTQRCGHLGLDVGQRDRSRQVQRDLLVAESALQLGALPGAVAEDRGELEGQRVAGVGQQGRTHRAVADRAEVGQRLAVGGLQQVGCGPVVAETGESADVLAVVEDDHRGLPAQAVGQRDLAVVGDAHPAVLVEQADRAHGAGPALRASVRGQHVALPAVLGGDRVRRQFRGGPAQRRGGFGRGDRDGDPGRHVAGVRRRQAEQLEGVDQLGAQHREVGQQVDDAVEGGEATRRLVADHDVELVEAAECVHRRRGGVGEGPGGLVDLQGAAVLRIADERVVEGVPVGVGGAEAAGDHRLAGGAGGLAVDHRGDGRCGVEELPAHRTEQGPLRHGVGRGGGRPRHCVDLSGGGAGGPGRRDDGGDPGRARGADRGRGGDAALHGARRGGPHPGCRGGRGRPGGRRCGGADPRRCGARGCPRPLARRPGRAGRRRVGAGRRRRSGPALLGLGGRATGDQHRRPDTQSHGQRPDPTHVHRRTHGDPFFVRCFRSYGHEAGGEGEIESLLSSSGRPGRRRRRGAAPASSRVR